MVAPMTDIDPAQAAPDHYKVLLENEHVRVLEMRLMARESDTTHSHPLKLSTSLEVARRAFTSRIVIRWRSICQTST